MGYGGGFFSFLSFLFQPIFMWILASCVTAVSAILTCSNWIVLYWALTKNKIYCPRIFQKDGKYYKSIGTRLLNIWISSFIGLIILCLLIPFHMLLDKTQVGTFYFGLVSTITTNTKVV